LACCGAFIACSGWGGFPAHQISAEIEASYDLAHGAGLSVIVPAMMHHYVEAGLYVQRMARFAEQVGQVERRCSMDDRDIALEGIEWFRGWLKSIGNPTTLADLKVPRADIERLAKQAGENPNGPGEDVALSVLGQYIE
jgi:alcohol dehydrogenase YqhD (iron-dependent ADH family)